MGLLDDYDMDEGSGQTQRESYLIARKDIETSSMQLDAALATGIRALMDHASFLLLLRECVETADSRFGDMWKELVR